VPDQKLVDLRVAILATDDFEESELLEPKKTLEQAGARVSVIAPRPGEIQAVRHDQKAGKVKVDRALDVVAPDDFDALVLPGGALNADALRVNVEAQDFVRAFDRAKKPIAFICHGPWLLVSAGLVTGRTLTSYHTIRDDIQNSGGHWLDEEVVRDGNWVSSRSPRDLPAFGRAMLELFGAAKRKAAA
jgi:protease I